MFDDPPHGLMCGLDSLTLNAPELRPAALRAAHVHHPRVGGHGLWCVLGSVLQVLQGGGEVGVIDRLEVDQPLDGDAAIVDDERAEAERLGYGDGRAAEEGQTELDLGAETLEGRDELRRVEINLLLRSSSRSSSCSSAKSTGERLRSSCEKRTEKASSAGRARLGSCCAMGLRGLSGTSLMSEASMAISETRSPLLDQPAARTRTLSSSPCVASPRELLALNTTLSEPSSSAVAVSTDSMASDSALQTSGVSTPRASCTRCSRAVAASKAEGGG